MERLDNFGRIAVLLTGAALISIGIITFLNIEIQSRSKHGVKIRNENLFEVFGRKVSEMINALKEKNSYRRSLLYHLFIPENTTRSSMRKLQYFTKDPNANGKKAEDDFAQTYHRIRHETRMKKNSKLFAKDKNDSVLNKIPLETSKNDEFATVFNDNKTTFENNGIRREAVKNSLEIHENCYTTNEVLEIIAATCLVNFIFWFLIILCVNTFPKRQNIWKFNRNFFKNFMSGLKRCNLKRQNILRSRISHSNSRAIAHHSAFKIGKIKEQLISNIKFDPKSYKFEK